MNIYQLYINNTKNFLQCTKLVIMLINISTGFVSSIFLAIYWRHTSTVFGEEHSTALLSLTLLVALVDCTSSVTFLPFMSALPAFYMSPFYVGENMSSLVSSLFGLAQGVEKFNSTVGVNTQTRGTVVESANFSQSVFFAILGAMMLFSLASYLLLSQCRSVKKLYLHLEAPSLNYERLDGSSLVGNDNNGDFNNVTNDNLSPMSSTKGEETETTGFKRFVQDNTWCFVCMLLLNVFQNGVMPSIGSYVYAPYGELTYHFGGLNLISCFSSKFTNLLNFEYHTLES